MLKDKIYKLINRLGWEFHRFDPYAYPSFQLRQILDYVKVDLVFDIGANAGQFAQDLRWFGYKGKIVSFEPLSSAYDELLATAHRDPLWIVHPRTAIGDFDGEIEINIAGNSVSSSLLPMLDSHISGEKGSDYIGSEWVPITRLDSVISTYIESDSRYFLKIDAQGFEWQVLEGAGDILKNAQGILCELSLMPLYEGQHLWREIVDRLENTGFTLWTIQKGFTDFKNGQSYQVNAVFIQTNQASSRN